MPSVKSSALAMLARREYSRRELQQKLEAKKYNLVEINQVLDNLVEQNLLNDKRFYESFIRVKLSQGVGPRKLLAQLKDKGITQDEVTISDAWANIDWNKYALMARRKRFGQEVPDNPKEIAKQMRFLQSRGFTGEQIYSALKNVDIDLIEEDY